MYLLKNWLKLSYQHLLSIKAQILTEIGRKSGYLQCVEILEAIHANLLLVRVSDPVHCGPWAVVLAFASWFYSLTVKEVEAWGQRSSFCSSALWWNPDLLFHSGILERFPTEPVLLLPYSHALDGCVFVSVWTCVCVSEEITAKL